MAPSSSLVSKIKVHLKLAISRLRIVQQKDTAIAKQQRRDMAQLLEQGKIESARIRVENIIRSDLTTELLEILELYCELLLARIGLMDLPTCDPGLEEAVKTVIYAAPRTEIKELHQSRQLLVEKYGKEFTLSAMENRDAKVPERVLKKLKVEPPSQDLVESYLVAIANAYDIKYGNDPEDAAGSSDNDDEHKGARSTADGPVTLPDEDQLSKVKPPSDLGSRSPVSIAPPNPSTENANPILKLPGHSESKSDTTTRNSGSGGSRTATTNGVKPATSTTELSTDMSDLEKRFALLKK